MQTKSLAPRKKRRYRVTNATENVQPVAPNILLRQFQPAAPNKNSAADTTVLRAGDG